MTSPQATHLVLSRPGYADLLVEEYRDRWQLAATKVSPAAVAVDPKLGLPALNDTVFARQVLPQAIALDCTDLGAAVAAIHKKIEVMSKRANRQTGRWTLHVFALDDDDATQQAVKAEKGLLTAVKTHNGRFFHRYVTPQELSAEGPQRADILVQVYFATASECWLSMTSFAVDVSPAIGGNRRMRDRVGAPSRSARKLEEAFVVMDRHPASGETAVDLGAAPGGWTFALARHGAQVTAVDHGALALPPGKAWTERVVHLKQDGLTYRPAQPVDWLCCDMLIGSRETLRILGEWLEAGLMHHFVVNIKLPQAKPWPVIKEALDLLQKQGWAKLMAKHLYHDRREITLMGRRT